MTKLLLALLILLVFSFRLIAQDNKMVNNNTREVSGIVQDSSGNSILGATVSLISTKDTLRTSTNKEGIFIIKSVKNSIFVLTISGIGIETTYHKYLYNPNNKRIILDPIIINSKTETLKEVTIKSKPTITFKKDTIEYQAADYRVMENATIDELLKKMEGMEVSNNGTLIHLGQPVLKARLNGKDFAGGDVAQAIQNLPANIVEKIQIIDDYGDQAARTGIKDGDPLKVLNITTKADKSVGNMARILAGEGSNSRSDSRVFLERINANQQIGLIGTYKNTINGVNNNTGQENSPAFQGAGGISNGTVGGNGGNTTTAGPSFNYRDQLGKKIELVSSYNYTYRNVKLINTSVGEQFSTVGTTYFNSQSTGNSRINAHNANFELDYDINKSNYLKVAPTFAYSLSNNTTNFLRQQTGVIHQDIEGRNSGQPVGINVTGTIFYQHLFAKPKRNVSIQVSYAKNKDDQDNTQNNKIIYYSSIPNKSNIDSIFNRSIGRNNQSNNIRTSITYSEPISTKAQFEVNAQINNNSYHNNVLTYNINQLNIKQTIDSLNNLYRYSFKEMRLSLNYRFVKPKVSFSLGFTSVSSILKGEQISNNTTILRNSFNLIPIAKFLYNWSKEQKLTLNYSGMPSEPSYIQLQPITDYSNPQNPITGNPYLKPSFRHNISTQFNHYIANSEINLLTNLNATLITNQVTVNNVLIPDINNTVRNLTTFSNLNGTYAINSNHSITKQFSERQYNLSLNGSIGYTHNLALNNNIKSEINTWRISERLGSKLNPFEWMEANPFVGYDLIHSINSLPSASQSKIKDLSLSIDGRIIYKGYIYNYIASKRFISGIDKSVSQNPFIVNMSIEKGLAKRNNFALIFQVFDLLNQNKVINRVITDNSIIDSNSNTLSRYFMFGFRLNLQKWNSIPIKDGKPRERRGDGSFIY